jgi:hypothetical protein
VWTADGSFSRVMFDEDRFSDDEARFSPVCAALACRFGLPTRCRATGNALFTLKLCAGVGEDLEDDPMTSEMFRAESVSDMRRLVATFVKAVLVAVLLTTESVWFAHQSARLWQARAVGSLAEKQAAAGGVTPC